MFHSRLQPAGPARLARLALAWLVFATIAAVWPAGPTFAAEPCTCVTYLKSGLGLIPGGVWAAKDYGPTLETIGFRRLKKPKRNAIMIFAPYVRGANDPAGHIALVTDVGYDRATGSWSVTVQHARWSIGTVLPGAGPCAAWGQVRSTTFGGLSDLSGLSFYQR